MSRNVFFYAAVIAVFGTGIGLILHFGSGLQPPVALESPAAVEPTSPAETHDATGGPLGPVFAHLKEPLSLLLLQVIVILLAARLLGSVFPRIGQPPVIGEMIAGILLGPSLLGLVAPEAQAFLFPADSLGTLRLLSQIGVILFMFVVGIELDVDHLRHKADAALLVSHASIVVPFFLGTACALVLYRTVVPAGIPFTGFALFMGVSMSVTAFPVLARIIEERGLSQTFLGTTAITCAAVDDVTAWCLLAVVVATVSADGLGGALVTIALTVLFIALMLFLVRPRIARWRGDGAHTPIGTTGFLAIVLSFVFVSALATEVIGIHALFGAFLAGVCMPRDSALRQYLRERLETFSSVFLLPLFFAFTGLRTEVGLLDDWTSWLLCASVVLVAIAGKLGGSTLAARWTGMSWGDSFALGALMNTRGLVELIVLNIGYDLGLLSPRIFTMLVLMALLTTLMTGPLLALVEAVRHRKLLAESSSARA
ncbi:MAG TPA: cation:proton antiporter [Thermoanaerobaculia bacterium]|nr:cation:proton antiporter [Thermoanaerobaculia bacterium]